MPSIQQDLRTKLTAAIKARDMRKANVIRMLDTKVMEKRTAKGFSGEVDDALYCDVIAAYQKTLLKARKDYEALGDKAKDNLEELDFEIAFCAGYLPEMLGEDQLREIVRAAIAEVGAKDAKMTGRVVGAVMKQHKGQVAAEDVKRLVTEELGG